MKKSLNLFSAVVLSATSLLSLSAHADYMNIRVGEGAKNLGSCGGTIEVNNGGNDNQVNVVLREVENCTFYNDSRGNDQRVQLRAKGQSFTLTTADEESDGSKKIHLVLHSNGDGHRDDVTIKFRVTGSNGGNGGSESQADKYANELRSRGTINNQAVIAFFGGNSMSDAQAYMTATCIGIGKSYAKSGTYKAASYDGEWAYQAKGGQLINKQIKVASQAAVWATLDCR
jgi:hypothetical protein